MGQEWAAHSFDYPLVYNKPFNDSLKKLKKKFNTLQHLLLLEQKKGNYRERLYKELDLEFLSDRRRYRNQGFFHKIVKRLARSYLQSYLLPDSEKIHNTRSSLRNTIKTFAAQTLTLRTAFLPYCTKE